MLGALFFVRHVLLVWDSQHDGHILQVSNANRLWRGQLYFHVLRGVHRAHLPGPYPDLARPRETKSGVTRFHPSPKSLRSPIQATRPLLEGSSETHARSFAKTR